MNSTRAGFLDSLVSAVRENPLAAALVGGGAFWLLIGNDKLTGAATSAKAAASPLVDISARNVRAAGQALRRTAAPPTAPDLEDVESLRVGEKLSEAARAASDKVSGTVEQLKDRFSDGVSYAKETVNSRGNLLPGTEALREAQSSLAEVLRQQPLALGAVGLAIGAAVAGAFRTSDMENELVGTLSDGVKADLGTRADAVSGSLREASDTLKGELGDAGAEAFDRVKQAGFDAANAAQQKVKTS